jgi:hypothetical protein
MKAKQKLKLARGMEAPHRAAQRYFRNTDVNFSFLSRPSRSTFRAFNMRGTSRKDLVPHAVSVIVGLIPDLRYFPVLLLTLPIPVQRSQPDLVENPAVGPQKPVLMSLKSVAIARLL